MLYAYVTANGSEAFNFHISSPVLWRVYQTTECTHGINLAYGNPDCKSQLGGVTALTLLALLAKYLFCSPSLWKSSLIAAVESLFFYTREKRRQAQTSVSAMRSKAREVPELATSEWKVIFFPCTEDCLTMDPTLDEVRQLWTLLFHKRDWQSRLSFVSILQYMSVARIHVLKLSYCEMIGLSCN